METTSKPTFTLTTNSPRDGRQVIEFTSAFATLADAYHALAGAPTVSPFAESLLANARARALTVNQVAWIHKLATEAVAAVRPVEVNLARVRGLLLAAAGAGKKFPKLHLQIEGQKVVLALTGPRSKTPGSVSITDGRPFGSSQFFGSIDTDGKLLARDSMPATLRDLLVALDADPAKAAGQHGVAIGRCVFCALELTDARSRSVGYGPICAEKHGLPWGDTSAADAADAEAKATTSAPPPAPVLPPATAWRGPAPGSRSAWLSRNPSRRDIGERY